MGTRQVSGSIVITDNTDNTQGGPSEPQWDRLDNAALIVILGHYGSGKTNFALNLARDLWAKSESLTIVDLDVVNAYFRTTDNIELLHQFGIEVLGPSHGASNLDTPSLQPGIDNKIREANASNPVILDVGGDPDGARALARFAPSINAQVAKEVLVIVNQARPDTKTVADNLEIITQIEQIAGIECTGLVGNTHLKEFTEVDVILNQMPVLNDLSSKTGLPIICIAAPRNLLTQLQEQTEPVSIPVYPIDQLVKTVWE